MNTATLVSRIESGAERLAPHLEVLACFMFLWFWRFVGITGGVFFCLALIPVDRFFGVSWPGKEVSWRASAILAARVWSSAFWKLGPFADEPSMK